MLRARGVPTRAQITIWLAVVVTTIVLSLSHFQGYQIGVDYDDARYLILSQSIVGGDGYGMINVPGEPPAERYPFGYPLILSIPVRFFPDNLDAAKVPSIIATVGILALLFWAWQWLGRGRSYWWAIAVVSLYALSPLTIDMTRRVMSEPVFTVWCLLALLLTEYRARGGSARWWTPAMSTTLVFVLFTRSVGIVLVLFVMGYLAFAIGRRFWMQMAAIVVQAAVLLSVIVTLTAVEANDLIPSEYLKDSNAYLLTEPLTAMGLIKANGPGPTPQAETQAGASAARGTDAVGWLNRVLVKGLGEHFKREIRLVALPIGGGVNEQALADKIGMSFLPVWIGLAVSCIVLLGLLSSLSKQRISAFSLFVFAYLPSLFLWNWNDPRFLYPIGPQIHLGLLSGTESIVLLVVARLPRVHSAVRVRNGVMLGLVLALALCSAYKSWQIEDTRPHVGDLVARTTWLKSNTAPSALVMSDAPELDYIYGGRKTVRYPGVPISPSELLAYLDRQNVGFIIAGPAIQWQASYKPYHRAMTAETVRILKSQELSSRVMLVHESVTDGVQVFSLGR